MSETLLVDSTSPQLSPATSVAPGSGSVTKTMSPPVASSVAGYCLSMSNDPQCLFYVEATSPPIETGPPQRKCPTEYLTDGSYPTGPSSQQDERKRVEKAKSRGFADEMDR